MGAQAVIRGARLIALGGLAIALGWAGAARAQQFASDATAKVRLTVALSRFVQWPDAVAADERPLHLCVFHESDVVSTAFATLSGTSLNGQKVLVLFNPRLANGHCQLLFVDDSAARRAAAALASVRDKPVLTLGAHDGFLAAGGMIELVNVDDKLRFDVDLVSMRNARLSLRAGALKLARRVKS